MKAIWLIFRVMSHFFIPHVHIVLIWLVLRVLKGPPLGDALKVLQDTLLFPLVLFVLRENVDLWAITLNEPATPP